MDKTSNKYWVLCVYLALVLATFIAYEPMRRNEFVNLDDGAYVFENPHVKVGITRESVIWPFTSSHVGNWHPLTGLSHILDCQLFGLNPFWHHFTSFLFHVANTLLLFWVLKRMTGAIWRSAFVAAAFALHPLHVESVAWVAERKDVLSGLFWILTMAAYVRYAARPSLGKYLLVVLALCLGLMAKPMLVTLPFVLLLLDYWPLGRLQLEWSKARQVSSQSEAVKVNYQKATVWRLIAEKIPLFVLVAVSSVVTFMVQRSAGAVQLEESFPINYRIINALTSYIAYLGKMIYPSHLAVFYPHLLDSLPLWQPILSALALIIVSAAVIYTIRRWPYLAVGWFWYLGTLVPVIGLVQVGSQAMADRYTYLPSIGIFIMVAWAVAELLAKLRYRTFTLQIAAGVVLVLLLLFTRVQVQYWQNSLTLFKHAVEMTENNFRMHNNYGKALMVEGHFDDAIEHFKEILKINPQYFKAQNNLGLAYYMKGEIEQAITYLDKALQLKPEWVGPMQNLAWIKATQPNPKFRDTQEAVRLAERACELTDYKNPALLDTLAVAYAAVGKFPEAVDTAKKALELAESSGHNQRIEGIRSRLHFFKAGKIYIESLPKAFSD